MQKSRIVLSVLAVGMPVILLYQSCGITKPRYIEYGEAEAGQTTSEGISNGTGPASDDTGDAAQVFALKIQPAIVKSCGVSSCHGGGAGALTLTSDNAEANRAALKDFSEDAQGLFDKISGPAHGGGDQSGNLALADIQEWYTAEAGGTPGGAEGSENSDPTDKECPPETIFLSQIQPGIAKSCGQGTCHGGGAGGLTLAAANDQAPANRTALYDFDPTSAAIFNKISSSSTHGGGDRSADLPKANIDAWIAAEDACK